MRTTGGKKVIITRTLGLTYALVYTLLTPRTLLILGLVMLTQLPSTRQNCNPYNTPFIHAEILLDIEKKHTTRDYLVFWRPGLVYDYLNSAPILRNSTGKH